METILNWAGTMAIYLPFFLFSSIFFILSESRLNKGQKGKASLFMVIGILALCILATLRSDAVGTDVEIYAKPTFKSISQGSSLFLTGAAVQVDFGYAFLAYVSAKLFNSFRVFLFLTEFCILAPIAACAMKNQKNASAALTMILYMLMYYLMGFNIMRQSIAVSFLMLGYFYWQEKKKFKTLLNVIISFLFHGSVVIMLVMLVVILRISRMPSKLKRNLILTAIATALALVAMQWERIMSWAMYDAGLLPTKYAIYLTIFSGNDRSSELFRMGGWEWPEYAIRICNVVLPLVYTYKKRLKSNELLLYRYSSYASLLIYSWVFLTLKTNYGYRLVMGLDYMNCFYFATLVSKASSRNKGSRRKYTISTGEMAAGLYALCYWFLIYFYFGMHEVVPYTIAA